MTKPTPFSARYSLGEQLLSEQTTNAASGLLQGGESRASASVSGIAPILLSQAVSGTAARTTIDLTFSTTMRAGAGGSIYITDGAVQTVLDSTGMPSLRIVGASDTREIAPSSVHFSGEHVLIDGLDLLPGHHYSVVISPGALQSADAKAFAGVRSPGLIAFSTTAVPSGDTTGPTLDAIHLDATKLKAGQDIPVTLTFSEKIATPSPAAFSTPHAELVDLHSDDGITWYATLKASAAVAAVANAFTVDMSMIRDLAGNAGRGTPPSATYDVDSMVGAWVVPHLSLMDDLGPDDEDLVTSGTTQELIGGIVGRMETGQHLELLINGTAVASDTITLHEFTEGSFTGYSWVYTGPVPDGSNSVVARVVDSAGHSSAEYTRTIVIDNVAPAMTSTANGSTDFSPSSAVVINFSEPMYWQPSEGSDSMIEVRDGFGNTSYVAFSLAQLSTDGRTLTIPASAHHFVAGADYRIALPATLTDIAGNEIGEHYISLHTAGTYVDTMPPRAVSAHVDTPSGVYGVGSVIEIHVVMNENVAMVGSAAPTLGLNNHATATFVSISGGKELVFQYVVGVGQDVSLLEVTDWTSLVNSVADLAGNKLDLSHIEFTHLENSSADMPGTSGIEIDTTRPAAPGTPVLAPDSDSAAKGDNVTNDDTPTLSGSGAEPGNAIELYDGETLVATVYADDSGNWSYTPASPMANKTWSFSVRQEDSAGNRSSYSGTLGVKVDTVANAPTLAMDSASDTGTVGDNVTGIPSPTIKGSAEAGALVKLYDGTTLIGTATADGSGNWSIVPSGLSTGNHTLTARQTDIAGNVSDASAGLAVTIDGNAPATLASAPALDAGSDSGAAGDLVTNDSTPRISGTGAAANATVKLYNGTTLLGSTTADTSGAWHVDITAALPDGSYALSARQLNAAGIESAASPVANVRIDTACAAPTIALDSGSDTGTAGDNVTKLTTPMIRGTAEAGARVDLYDGATLLGTTTANASGIWSIITTALTDGAHALSAKQTDIAGNASAASASLWITVDSVAPSSLSAPLLASTSDSGALGDNITSDVTPKVYGSGAEPGATIQLYGSSSVAYTGATTTADASGNWSYEFSAVFSEGGFSVLAKQVDAAGNASALSPGLALTFDKTAPAAPNMHLEFASDTGTSDSDRITKDTTPTFTGTAEAGATIKLYAGSSEVGSATANASGAWSITTSELAPGDISFGATQTDKAGNVSSANGPIPVTIDTSAAAPGTPVLDASTDTGVLGDSRTTNLSPKFSGSGAEAGAKVQVYAGEDKLGEATADDSGNWSVTSHSLLAGTYSITALQIDKAGNTSASSGALSLVLEPLAAFITVTFGAERANVSGSASGAEVVDGAHPPLATLVGIGAPWAPLAEVPAF